MIVPSIHYYDFYLVLVTILSVVAFIRYSWLDANNNSKTNNVIAGLDVLIVLFIALYIGLRDPFSRNFGDTYWYTYFHYQNYGRVFHFDWNAENLIFDNLLNFMSSNQYSVSSVYILISFIYFGGIWYACKRLFPKDSLAAFIVYLAAFSTFSYSVNGIKAGVAASAFLIALAVNEKDGMCNKMLICVLLLLSIGFHHSMKVPVVAFVACKLIKKPQFYTVFWLVCFFLAAFNITYFQDFFVGIGEDMDDEKIVGYLSGEALVSEMGITGFRYDFVIYSVIPILFGWIMMYFKDIKLPNYVFLLNLYTMINAVWLLCINAEFTNRIAYLSWLMYPIVLIYPFLNSAWGKEHYNTFKVVAYGHLAFTLFMHFVYYN